ncbi:hypothetical protein M8W81_004694 [Salmonella enterica]|nr:hypothetical protein [Salmonella enterica]EJF6007266.1 hypothetical protein [Salmonella enterica]EJF6164723.1 hypothetical protein [Salmonella enterica]
MKYKKLFSVLFILSFSVCSEMNPITNNVSNKENQICPDWKNSFNEINKFDNSVISVKSRGDYNSEIPENSLKAFDLSYSRCRPAIEFLVRLTKDGYPIIFNDTHIERMTQSGYNAETGTNFNADDKKNSLSDINSLSLSQIKGLNLINVNGGVTNSKIPTLDEFIKDYKDRNPGTLVFIDPGNDSSTIIGTIKVLDDAIEKYGDKSLASRFIIKVNIETIPTPQNFSTVLESSGVKNSELMNFNPVIKSKYLSEMNESDPNAGKYIVSLWLQWLNFNVPVFDLELKNEQKGVVNGSMAEIVQVIRTFEKRIGVYVPVPDYILWRKEMVSGFTVNHSFGDKKPVDVMTAFYNEDGTCCFVLKDNVSPGEDDMRMNLGWQKSVGGSIFTSLDTDSVEQYFKSQGELNLKARPEPSYPVYAMRSGISWIPGKFVKPSHSSVMVQVNNNLNLTTNKEICIYGKAYDAAYIFNCNDKHAHSLGYNDKLLVKMAGENSMYIYDPATNLCLTSPDPSDNLPVWFDCIPDFRWVRHGDDTIESYTYPGTFLTADNNEKIIETRQSKENNIKLKMLSTLNRWTYPE